MNHEKNVSFDCRRFEALEERRAEGDVLTAEELDFCEAHLALCSRCRATAEIQDLLAYESMGDGPLEPLDEVSLRRHVADILEAVEQAGPLPATGDGRETAPRAVPSRRLALGALAAALAATLAVVIFWPRSERVQRKSNRAGARGRLLYRSGAVALSGSRETLAPGAEVKVGRGRAGMVLPCQAAVVAFSDTKVRVDRLGPRACDIHLVQGRIFVSVKHLDPPVSFVVHTGVGTVSVRGTAFSVSAGRGKMQVAVLRGLVAVDDRRAGLRMVAAGQGYDGEKGVSDLPSSRVTQLAVADSGLRLLSAADERGLLTLESQPSGASVSVDGVELGACPLEARIPAGLHSLRLSWPNGETARLTVDVPAGGSLSKTITARPRPAEARVGGSDATSPGRVADAGVPVAGKTPARSSFVSADRLMAEARKLRSQGRWRQAAAVYRRIVSRHRGKAVAATAEVLLGWVLLRHLGRPAAAMRRFDAYLARGGPLSQEAAYGKILALRRLGKTDAERRAIQAFLKRYPRALQVSALRRRLGRLSGAGTVEGKP